MNNPIKNFTKKEWILWIASLLIVIVSNLFSTDFDLLTLMAALIGVTSLIFAAKGNVWAQILMIMFSILYGIISYRFRYWGEMITYLGMALPMAYGPPSRGSAILPGAMASSSLYCGRWPLWRIRHIFPLW